MKEKAILITGANGEMGHGLIQALARSEDKLILALDLTAVSTSGKTDRVRAIQGDILDTELLSKLGSQYEFDIVFHLAALLSTTAEKDPVRAHRVNVDGSLNVLEICREQAKTGPAPKFMFPSSIAAYGLTPEQKQAGKSINEDECLNPITMYGINKLYIEQMGRYYSKHFALLAEVQQERRIDFRSIRFPGILSADTAPRGGTSDYAPHMLHTAARGEAYECYVKPDTRLPFMVMPDAVSALLKLASANKESLTREVYNVSAFSLTAEEISQVVSRHIKGTKVSFDGCDTGRLKIVESWPGFVDDSAARKDFAWQEKYRLENAFSEYLIPKIKEKYT